MDLYRLCVYPGSYVQHGFSIFKVNSDNRNGESSLRPWRYIICIFTCGLCSNNARVFNDDVTAIGVCARLHRGRNSNFAHIEMITAKMIKPVTLYPVSGCHHIISTMSQTSAIAWWTPQKESEIVGWYNNEYCILHKERSMRHRWTLLAAKVEFKDCIISI